MEQEIDWRIRRTFEQVSTEKGKVKTIDTNEFRKYYILATGNQSHGSFYDFLNRCNIFGFVKWEQGDVTIGLCWDKL